MRPRAWRLFASGTLGPALTLLAAGCTSRPTGNDLDGPATAASAAAPEPELALELREKLNAIVNELGSRYRPLTYEFDEGLLRIADRAEAAVAKNAAEPTPRVLPNLDPAEEMAHLRATIGRWERRSGQSFRGAIDPLIAEVGRRQPGESVPPDFHKRFGLVFDSFIAIEVDEIRERRNRAVRARTDDLLSSDRQSRPEVAARVDAMLDGQYPRVAAPDDPPR